MTKPDMMLWLSDNRGVYVPRDFAECFADRAKSVVGVTDEQWAILEAGPDNESYWDVWTEVCYRAVVVDNDGVEFTIHQDGDCWLVPKGMEWDDETETFKWPDEEELP